MPLPARVVIALPGFTQLLTASPALNASRRYTACGPPPRNATGMSRPIAADGTVRYSTPAAVAVAGAPADSPAANSTGSPTPPSTVRAVFTTFIAFITYCDG